MNAHGAKAKLYVGKYNLSGHSNSIAPSMTMEPVDVTSQGQSDPLNKEFIPGLVTWKLAEKGFWDYAAGTPEAVLQALEGTQGIVIFGPGGANIGEPAFAGYNAPFASWQVMAPVGGATGFTLDVSGSEKMSRCKVLGNTTLTGAGSGAAQDLGAAGTTGVEAFLVVTAFSGTDATIKVQSSADGSTGWADRVTFTQVTAATSERLLSGTTTNQYLRYNVSTSGGFSSLSFVVVARNVAIENWN